MDKKLQFTGKLLGGYVRGQIENKNGKIIYSGPYTAVIELYNPPIVLVGKKTPIIAIGEEKNISELEKILKIEKENLE